MPIGVQLGTIAGNSVVDIFGNDIGLAADRVNVDGISITSIATGGDVNVYDNDIFATLDGIYVDGSITGAGTTMLIAGNRIDGQQDGVDLGLVSTGAVVNVGGSDRVVGGLVGPNLKDDGNTIKAGTNGIEFDGGIDSTVNIDGNKIHAGVDGVNIRDDADTTGVDGGTVNIRNNDIGSDGTDTVGFNGIHFIDSITNGSIVRVSGNNIGRSGARVDNGVIFDGAITGANTDVQVENGNVIWADVNGVVVNGEINGVKHFVVEQSTINANSHGVHINGNVVGAQDLQVNVNNITSNNNHGVFFNGNVSNSLVIVNGNTNIDAFEDGVRFGGTVTGGTTQVQSNTIVADDHGVAFIGAVSGGAALHLHDNVIIANEDNAVVGSGFYFGGPISSATINIGDGERDSNPSNFITVAGGGDDDTDGIHFAGTVGTGAVIKIDGNRIGYNGNGTVNAIKGDGIEFAADVNGNADIDIIDNRVRAIGNPSGTGDGVKFSGHIGGTANVAVGVSPNDGNNIDVTGDGVEFNGITGGTVSVASNTIVADENGIEFGAGSPSIEGGADVFILSNTINAALDGIYVDDDITGAGTTFTAKRNTITADDDGIDIDNVRNGAVVHIGGAANGGGGPLNNEGNRITADGNGIEFDAGIDATVLIQKNRISAGDDGINVRDDDGGHTTAIDTGAIVNILDNTIGFEGSDTVGRHGIHVEEDVVGNSTINIGRNNIGRAGAAVDNGIHFGGVVNGSHVNIFSNNHGIHADGHGIYFGGNLVDADIDINDNIINADDDDSGNGDGIRFDGQVSGSTTVNIGDGVGSNLNSGSSNIISGEDGIHFAQDVFNTAQIVIDGNRIGYDGLNVGGTVNPDRVGDDGIEFADWVYDASNVTITDNWILSEDEGVVFNDVYGTGKILIGGDVEAPDGNHIDADGDGIQFSQGVHGQRLVEISYNEIDADNDGISFLGTVNNALDPANSEQELLITRNDIWGDRHGVHFAGAISNARHDTVISYNTIEGEDEQGVVFDSTIDDAHIRINNNARIEGEIDGVRFLGEVDSAQIDINDNIRIQGNDEEAIHFFQEVEESIVNIIGNDNLLGGDHGIEFAGVIDESNITISGNNDGIHADNHGILFGAAIEGDSVINIHDNIISANEDGGAEGDGIHFAGTVTESDIFIGDGFGSSLTNNPSNVISGVDGIHFAANIGENADIVIDGNRIGYNEPRLNPSTGAGSRVTDDGISFAFLSHNAEITITDNWIRSADDGIIFNNNVDDDVQILIGGDNEAPDGNTIDAWGDGVQFAGDITGDSLVEVSFNDIEADDNGIEFNGTTSNDDDTFPFRDDEILIANNSIEADEYGIVFFGRAEDERHDIMIRDNTQIHGHGAHGIAHLGGIDDAELRIIDNDDVFGDVDGIHIAGAFTNDALILIDGNTDIDSGSGDGIEVTQSGGGGGVDLNITDNHIHFTGDNGIEIDNVDNVWIANNRIHDAGADGIYVEDSDNAQIRWNRIRRTGDDGIDVRRSNGANIEDNRIRRTQGDGIQVRDSSFVEIDDNRIRFAGDDGIDFEDGFFSAITDNNIRFTDENGIEVNDSAFILIDENEVADADEAGIFIDPSAIIFVTNNLLTSNDIGLHVQGPNNGYINVTGNTFTDNRIGALFESGIIDLTDVSSDPAFGGFGNKFIGGQHGMVFDAANNDPTQLSLVRTGGFFAGGFTYDGTPNDTWPAVPTNPVNFGGTIGSQYFEGQSISFVTLRRNTFTEFRGTEAIWLDATDSTYFRPGFGAFSPADTGDILTQDQLDFLESMFRHRPDASQRGIFWFGALPAPEGVEFLKDPIYDPFDGGVSGLNVTITGLPRVSGFAPASTGAAGLNAIAPAAGDETTTADLANIEPAAGGEGGQNVSCWSDAVNAAGTGGPVNYSYGGTFEESIAAAASCGAQSF
jgi:parallel beta-helix repeat protein